MLKQQSEEPYYTYSSDDEEEKKTKYTDDEREVTLEEALQSRRKLSSDDLFSIKGCEFMTVRVVYSLDGNFEEDEYFKYQGKVCLHSDYEVRNWQDKYTAVKIGRFTYSLSDDSKVLNDIAFDAETVDPATGEAVIGDKNVSKEHATILYDQGQYYLADLGSVNSTFIRVQDELVLREGTVFDI